MDLVEVRQFTENPAKGNIYDTMVCQSRKRG